jgi:beta-galactosidase
MCLEDSDGLPSTLLRDALGLTDLQADPPFVQSLIHAFGYRDVPVSFVETYSGDFDEVIATRAEGETVGFAKTVGQGQALMLGAALPIYLLEDLEIINQMGLKLGCPPAFTLSEWADVRLSRGERGSFLFINNYQDDPLETTLAHHGAALFGGHPIRLPARQGAILPLDWRLRPGLTVNYVTAEIVAVSEEGGVITLETAQAAFEAELTLTGYHCDDATVIAEGGEGRRVRVRGSEGRIVLRN